MVKSSLHCLRLRNLLFKRDYDYESLRLYILLKIDQLYKDIDAVLISSPAYTHADFMEAAALSGKHIYCEKPVSPDVDGCRKMERIGERFDKKLSMNIGFQMNIFILSRLALFLERLTESDEETLDYKYCLLRAFIIKCTASL